MEKYESYYKYNSAIIVCWKSKRRNSKCSDAIMINHLISQEENGKVSDKRILQQLINVAEKAASYCKEYNNIFLSVDLNIYKRCQYANYQGIEASNFYNPSVKFGGIEKLIHYLFNLFTLIYPYNTLSIKTVFEDCSIKYIIENYNNK